MLPVSIRPRMPVYNPDKTFHDAATALSSGKDAIKEVNGFKENSLASATNDLVDEYGQGDIYTNEENAKTEFVKDILKQIVVLAFDDDQSEVTLFETPEKAYVLQKEAGKICFCKLSYSTEFSIRKLGYVRKVGERCTTEIHGEIDIKGLPSKIKNHLTNFGYASNPLLDHNPKLLDFAAKHIIKQPHQNEYVIQAALRYSLINDVEAACDADTKKRLDFLRHDRMTPEFRDFVLTGKKPEGQEKLSELFCNFFRVTLEKSSNLGEFGYPIDELPYYQSILSDISHLNMAEYLSFNHWKTDEPEAFVRPLFLLLRDHYAGKSLEFDTLAFVFDKEHPNDYQDAFCELIKCNSHLTTVKFRFDVPGTAKVIEALQNSPSITDIGFEQPPSVHTIREILKNPNLKSLEIPSIWNEDLCQLLDHLKNHPSLTTLTVLVQSEDTAAKLIKMEGRITTLHLIRAAWSYTDDIPIWHALLSDSRLTSFKYSAAKSASHRVEIVIPDYIKKHLQSNLLRNSQIAKTLLVPSLFDLNAEEQIIPRDVIKLICDTLWSVTER